MFKSTSYFLLFLILSIKSYGASVNVRLDFKFRSGIVQPDKVDNKMIEGVARLHDKFPHSTLFVSGHTDSQGPKKSNQTLSEARAEYIKGILTNAGTDPLKVNARGYGETVPVGTNATDEGRVKNRRVVVTFFGLTNTEAHSIAYTITGHEKFKKIENSNDLVSKVPEAQFDSFWLVGGVSKEETDDYNFETTNLTEDEKEALRLRLLVGAEHNVLNARKDEYIEESGGDFYVKNAIPFTIKEEFEKNRLYGLDKSVVKTKKVVLSEPVEPKVILKKKKVKRVKKVVTSDKKPYRNEIGILIGPNITSNYYEGDADFQYGDSNLFGLGLRVKKKLTTRFFLSGFGYYLPTSVEKEDENIAVKEVQKDYANLLFGLHGGYAFKANLRNRMSILFGVNYSSIGGIENTAGNKNGFSFTTYNHMGLNLGLSFERRVTRKWKFISDLSYVHPLSMSGVKDFSGKLWWRGHLGLERNFKKNFKVILDYQVAYHESEVTFESGLKNTPEFLIHSFMLGLKYTF